MCQHHVSKIRRDVANDGNRKAIDVRKRWCLSKHVALRPVGWLTRQAGVRSWTPVAGAALGVSSRPVSVGGGGTAPSLCRLRAPRGCDPCNQANVVWCAALFRALLEPSRPGIPLFKPSEQGPKILFFGGEDSCSCSPHQGRDPQGGRLGSGIHCRDGELGRRLVRGRRGGVNLSTPFDPW